MRKGFVTGVLATLLVQFVFLAGVTWGIPSHKPVDATPRVEREVSFRVMAPKGMEEFSYVALECRAKPVESARRSGKKPSGKWKPKSDEMVAAAASDIEK